MTPYNYSFSLPFNADWFIQILNALAVCILRVLTVLTFRRLRTHYVMARKQCIILRGGNEVCLFNADPIFVRKFLILDSKSVTNFGP